MSERVTDQTSRRPRYAGHQQRERQEGEEQISLIQPLYVAVGA